MLPHNLPEQKILLLGTALWGWGVDKSVAFQMLDRFVASGGTIVDTAENYPINNQPDDFGLAAQWIEDWVSAHGYKELSVLLKVGSVDNSGGPSTDLRSSHILDVVSRYQDRLDSTLSAVSIHWDNRGIDEVDDISDTLEAMIKLSATGYSIGLSGIRNPDLYYQIAPELSDSWWIQVKENVQTNDARMMYEKCFPNANYLAYGINMGGLKNVPPTEKSSLALRGLSHSKGIADRLTEVIRDGHGLKPRPSDFNELALMCSYLNNKLDGVIIGPRNIDQLDRSISYWNRLIDEAVVDSKDKLVDLNLLSA